MIIQDLYESPQTCPECGGPSFSDLILAEKKDACYHKVKASAKVWPSAYASGRLVQCRKKGADNYGNKSESMSEDSKESYMIIRTDAEGKKDVFAGNFDTYERAQKELDACLAHPLHTKYKQKFEIKRKGGEQGVAEAQLDEKCWDGYQQQGMKNKSGRQVPNCVPAESVNEMDKSQTPPGRDGSNDLDAGKKEYTATPTTPGAVGRQGVDILNKAFRDSQRVDPRTGKKMNTKGVAEDQVNEKSVSQAQFRTMAAAAHNPEFAKKVGIKQSVAKEFHSADKSNNYKKLPDRTTEGEVEKTKTGMIHRSSGAYGGGEAPRAYYDPGKYAKDIDHLDKGLTAKLDKSMGIKWPHGNKKSGMDEGEQQKGADYRDPPEADYGDDYQDMVARVKKLAGLGPLKTVYDPTRRQYRNMPTAQQPKK